ncbi:MAG: phosphotransferase, partial [Burkholderiaceae bacterium]|nr:phosphotransferase [Burkholderiaceae bacterium]
MTAELDLHRQGVMVRALQAALSAGDGPPAELIETHISFVLLQGEWAYKFKKALKNPFLDASTLALREHLCQEELRLNRRLAPDLYRDVVPVCGTPEMPALGGHGPIIDHAVRMVAFPQAGLWDRLAGDHALGPGPIDELAALLVRFHDVAAPADSRGRLGSPPLVRAQMRENLDELERLAATGSDRARVQGLRQWEADLFPRLEPLMAERLASGRVRECHGDLHLGNVAQIDGRATVFDAIEFNDEFRWIDVISEVAFVVMDLHAHELPELAHRLLNAWLQASGDYAGLPVLPYYLVHRALVRAKVALMRAAQTDPNERTASAAPVTVSGAADSPAAAADSFADGPSAQAQRYLALADRFSRPQRPGLMLTHGFSGTGKTTLTQGLVEQAGALRIRADVERKRLAGLDETSRSGSAL